MFSPLGALGAGYRGYTEGRDKAYETMGVEALGKTFQQPQGNPSGPIDQMNAGPMPPSPGQSSMPAGPSPGAAPPPVQQALGPGAQGPMPGPQPSPQGSPPQQMAQEGAPSPGQRPPSQAGRGMDLYSLSRRIQMANPDLPPQAMVAALTRALPLLNVQAKQQLLDIRRQMYGLRADTAGRSLDLRERGMDQRDKALGQRDQRLNQPPPEAIKALREGHITTFANGTQWTLQDGQPKQVAGGAEPQAAPAEAAPVGGSAPAQ